MKLLVSVCLTIGLWALFACAETETNRTSKATSSDSEVKSEVKPEPTKLSLQDRPREGRKEPLKGQEKDGQDDDESKEESGERQIRSRVPYGYKPGIQGGPRGLPHAPVKFGNLKRFPSEDQSNFSQPLYEKKHKRLHPSVHSTRLNVSASEGHKTEAQQESPDAEHGVNNEHDNRASAPADQAQNPLPNGPQPTPHHEVQDPAPKAVLRPPPAIRPLPHVPAEPHIRHQAGAPLVGRGPVYPQSLPGPQQSYPFSHGSMQLTQGGFRPTFGPQYPPSQTGLNNEFNGLFGRPFGLPASNFGLNPSSDERFANSLDGDVHFNQFGGPQGFPSSAHNGSRFGSNSLQLQPSVDFNRGISPLASFGNNLNGFQQNLGFGGLINSAENADFIGFGGNSFGSHGFGNGNPGNFDNYFQGYNSNPFPIEGGDLRLQPNSLGDGGPFSGQNVDVMSNAVNHQAGIARQPLQNLGGVQSLTQHPANLPRQLQPIYPAPAANAQTPNAGIAVPPMPPSPADNRPYSILPGGNFHSRAKSASDIHYVNRPFTKPPCASLSSRKNATFCVKDDQYPRDSVVQSAFIDPLTARRLVPYIPDEELVSAESNDVKTQSSLSEACTSEIKIIRPMRAKNTKGMWKVIVNVDTPMNGQQYKQLIHTETCRKPGAHCHVTRKSVCVQKFTMHRLAAWSPQEGLHMDSFRFPVACSCLLA